MISRKKSLREVYVWELPVRIFHWVNATAIVALCVTGYIIGNPPAIQHATPPEANYWFGWVRFIHFAAAFVFDTTKIDVLLLSPKPVYDIGHNSLAAFTYFGVFVLFIIQTITGLAMFCVSTNNVMEPFFTWVLLKCGGFFVVRQIHHIAMWAFILFTIAHIYLVFYHDYIERNGIASSIIGGWKFVREDLAEEYETEQKQQQQLQKQKDGIANETTEK